MPIDAAGLFAEHHAPLFRYLARLTGDPDLAEDAAQEAFVKLMEKPPAPGQTRAWLYRVATNAAWLALRTRGRRRVLLLRAPGRVPAADPPPAPDAEAELSAERARVRRALDTLSPRERQMVLMQQEGFRYREIAEAVGTTTNSVGTMIARALDKLAAQLRLDEEDG